MPNIKTRYTRSQGDCADHEEPTINNVYNIGDIFEYANRLQYHVLTQVDCNNTSRQVSSGTYCPQAETHVKWVT